MSEQSNGAKRPKPSAKSVASERWGTRARIQRGYSASANPVFWIDGSRWHIAERRTEGSEVFLLLENVRGGAMLMHIEVFLRAINDAE